MELHLKIFSFSAVIVLIFSGIQIFERHDVVANDPISRGITITVDQSGSGDYTSIQRAIDNATDGDKIVIYPGTYLNSIIVDKDLRLEGLGENETVIKGDGTNTAITIVSKGASIFGIKFINCYKCVVIDGKANNNSIINCVFDNSSYGAISITSASSYRNTLIRNNLIIKSKSGIGTWLFTDRISIINNTFIDITNIAIGVSSNDTNIISNRFDNIGQKAILQRRGNSTINNNIINNSGIGIELDSNPFQPVIISNNVIINSTIGINLINVYWSGRPILNKNVIQNMEEYGIYCSYSTFILDNSTISNCNISGIRTKYSGYGEIRNCVIENSKDGIYGYNGAFNVTDSIITNNSGIGLYISDRENREISGNTFSNNGQGISLENCENFYIYGNYFVNNTIQASQEGTEVNRWYASHPVGGNYWSDHDSRDVKRGAQQALWGSDGFCDNSYTITGGGWDTYPIFVDKVNPEVRNISDVTIDPGTVYHFDCTESWDDQMVTSALWEFIYDDISRSITHLEYDFQFNTTGVYPVNLTVYDYYGNSDRTSFNITVLDSTAPVPMVDNSTMYVQGDTVAFNGSGSYDNAGIVNWTWVFDYEGEEQLLYGELAHFTFIVPGYYDCKLFVSDEAGHSASLDFILTVVDLVNPVCDAGRDLIAINGELITFDGTGSTDNSIIANYTWNFTYDGEEQTYYGDTFSFYFITPGYYKIYLTVMDLFGNVDSDVRNIKITDTHPPNAVINGSRTLLPGERLVLDGSSSTDNGRIIKYQWTFDDGGPISILGEFLDYEIINIGEILVTLTVWDSSLNNDSTQAVITYLDTENPIANAGADITVAIGTTVTFNGSASTDNGRIVKYQWEFIYDLEEVTLFGETQTFTFDASGSYNLLLTVYDQSGNTGDTTFIVNVIGTGNLEGVVNDENGKPIEGAKVTFLQTKKHLMTKHSTTTDSMGRFSFTDIPMGKASYTVSKGGFGDFEGEVNIPALGTASLESSDIVLEEEAINPSPNAFVIFGLILLVLIIIAVVVFLVVRSKKKGEEETESMLEEIQEETTAPQEEPQPDEVPISTIEKGAVTDEIYQEPQTEIQGDLQEDIFGNYDLPPEETQQLVEPPIEDQGEPVGELPQEDTVPLDGEMRSEMEYI